MKTTRQWEQWVQWMATGFVLVALAAPVLAAEITTAQISQARNEAIGEGLALVYEEATGIPADKIGQMLGQLSGGDYKAGILTAASIATDAALGLIPGVGPVKFVVGLENAVIKLGKSYLDDYMVDVAWSKFKGLSATDQAAFINGQEVPDMTYGLGDYYTARNVTDLQSLFKVYRDIEQEKASTMQSAAALIADVKKAREFLPAEGFLPRNGAEATYSSTMELEWWAYDANYFQIVLKVAGGTYTQTVKVNPYDFSPAIALSRFGVDWSGLFKDNAYEPLDVTWSIKSARYDSTGLLESVFGSELVIASSKLIHVEGYDSVKESAEFTFKLKSDMVPVNVTITSPAGGYETGDNQVTVTAALSVDEGVLPAIGQVGFVVNGEVQYATLNGTSFSTVAILKSGDNSIQAGAITADGNLFLSNTITVKSSALNNTYHVRITWDKDNTDVDLHFSWKGSDCYFGNPRPQWVSSATSPTLDVDDTNGFGPENITIDALPGSGTYRIWVDYWSDHEKGPTTVYATITKEGQSIFSNSRTMSDGENWTLLEFTIP